MLSEATSRRLDTHKTDISTKYSKGIRNVGQFNGCIRAMEVLHGGNKVWSAEQDGSISIRTGMSGAVQYSIPKRKDVFVHCLMAQHFYIWAGMSDGFLRIYNTENNELVLEIKQHAGAVLCLLGHCGRVYSGSTDWQIYAWDGRAPEQMPETVKNLLQFSGHQNSVRCMAIDERHLFSAGDDCVIRCWDIDTAMERHHGFPIAAHKAPITSLLVHDVNLFSSSHDGSIKVWNTQTGKDAKTLHLHTGQVISLLRDPTSNRMWSGGSDGIIGVWDTVTLQLITKMQDHQGTMVTGLKMLCRANAMKVWTVGANGVVKVWYSETEAPEVDYSNLNKMEDEFQSTIDAMRSTIIQNYQELELRKEQLSQLQKIDHQRKQQFASVLGRACQMHRAKMMFVKMMEFAEYKKRLRSLPQLSNSLMSANRRLLATVYFRKWSSFTKKEQQQRPEIYTAFEQVGETALVVKYLGKLNEYVKLQESRQQRTAFAKTLERTWNRTLAARYYHLLLMWRLINKSKRKARAIATVMASAQDRAQMTVHLERLVAFSKAERKREQRHQFATYLARRNFRVSMGGVFHKWMLWSSHRRTDAANSNLSLTLVKANNKQMIHSYFRKWMVWRMAKQIRRLTSAYADKEENGKVLQMCIEEQRDLSDEVVEDTYHTVKQKYTRAQEDFTNLQSENIALLQHQRSLEKEKQILLPLGTGGIVGIYNAMHILKAKFLNFNTDIKLIVDLREKSKRIAPAKLFQTAVINFKHYLNETQKLPPSGRPGKYNAYAQQCIKEMAITFDMLPFENKETLNVDEDLAEVMVAVFNIVEGRAR